MLHRILPVWVWFRSDYPGFCLGTSLLITLMMLMYTGGIQACLSVGPGGDLPRVIGNCYIMTVLWAYVQIWYFDVGKIKASKVIFFYCSLSPHQMCSCMPSVMMSCPLCWSVLFSCCWLDDARNVAGEQWLSWASPPWQWPYYLFFTPWPSLLVGVKQLGSVVTQQFSWHCLQRSAVRWNRGGCWGVYQSGFSPGCFCWLVCCCCPRHRLCFTSAQYASGTTVSFHVYSVFSNIV